MPRKATAKKSAPAPLVRDVSAVRRQYLRCHSKGHQWRHEEGVIDPIDADPGMRPPYGQTAVGERSWCVSCGCEKVAWYTRSGSVDNKYRHPEGYLHKKEGPDGDPAPSKLEWRLELVTTLFDQDLRKPARAS